MGSRDPVVELELGGDEGAGAGIGNVVRALQAALTQGDLDLAARMYEDSGQHVAEQLFTTVLQTPAATRHNAARMFVLARDFARAARLYEQLKAWPDAAHIYEEASDFAAAGRCWKRSGDLSRAARNLDAAGDADQAVALYEQIGDRESRADCLLRSGRFFEAADLYVELGNVRGEVDALRKVPQTDPRRVDAVKRLAPILARRNRLAEATQLAADALRENEAAKKDLGFHELLVDLLVRQGLHDQAERVRPRMQRIAARERIVAAAPPPPPSASGPAPAPLEDYGFLKAIPLFGKLPLQDMKDLYRLSAEVTYKPGAIVVEEGVDAPGLIVIVEGSAEVVAIGAGGARHLNSLGPGDHLGEISLISRSVTSARVVASSLVRALKISPDRFAGFVHSHPAGAVGIYRLFSEKLAERVRALSTPEGG